MKKHLIVFTISNIVGLLFNTMATLWCANLAGPQLMGLYNTFQLIVNYSPILTFGIFNGLNREIPYFISKFDTNAVYRFSAVAQLFSLILSVISASLLVFISIAQFFFGRTDWGYGFVAFSAIVSISYMRNFVEVTYRTGQDFEWLSITKIITSILAIATVPLLYFALWQGLLLRALIIAGVGFFLLWSRRKIKTKSRWDFNSAKHLVSIGFPIFVVGYIFTGLLSIDRLIIISEFGYDALGAYTPAILILQGMFILPTSVMQVIYPKAVEFYGRSGSAKAIVTLLYKPVLILGLIQLPLLLIAWQYIPDFIASYMPKFSGGILAAQWSVIAGYVLSLGTPALAFNILKRQISYGSIIFFSGIVLYLSAKYFIFLGFGLASVSMAATVGFSVFVLGCGIGAYIICRDGVNHTILG